MGPTQSYGFRLWHIWSQTHMVPGRLVPRNWSPFRWSLWTNSPSGQTVPNQFSPLGQMVPKTLVLVDKWSPTNLVPLDKWSLEYSVSPLGELLVSGNMWTKLDGDHLYRGTKFLGTICPWRPNLMGNVYPGGINFMGIICPRGQEVGDRKSRDQMRCSLVLLL